MKSRRTVTAVAILASLVVFAFGCGGSDDNTDGSSNTKKVDKTEKTADTESESDNAAESTTDTLADGDFNAKVDNIINKLKAAGSDPCAVSAAQEFEPPEPANPTQVKKVVEVYTLLLRSMAGSLPESAAESTAALNRGADAVDKVAADANLTRDFFSSEGLLKAISSTEMSNAIAAFADATTGCPGTADLSPSTSAPN